MSKILRLNCGTDRRLGKSVCTLEKEGRILKEEVFLEKDEDILSRYYKCIIRGLNLVKSDLDHDTTLVIVVDNQKVCDEMNGNKENKSYSDLLDSLYDTIDTIDFTYNFVCGRDSYVKNLLEKGKIKTMKVSGLDFMKDM